MNLTPWLLWAALVAGDPAPLPRGARREFSTDRATAALLRVPVAAGETITVFAESFDVDVALRVESDDGTLLAADDDTGIATNPWLVYRAEHDGPAAVRVTWPAAVPGRIRVCALRGALPLELADATAVDAAYWLAALQQAMQREDALRAALAVERWCALTAGDAEGARAVAARRIDLRDAIAAQRSRAAERAAAGDLAAARQAASQGLQAWLDEPEAAADPLLLAAITELTDLAMQYGEMQTSTAAAQRTVAAMSNARVAADPELIKQRLVLQGQIGDLVDFESSLHEIEALRDLAERTTDPESWIARRTVSVAILGLMRAGRVDDAERQCENLLSVLHRLQDAPPFQLGFAQNELAGIAYLRGEPVRALALSEAAIAALERAAPDQLITLVARRNQALIRRSLGDVEGARALLESVEATLAARFSADHPDLLDTRQQLAELLLYGEQYAQAARRYEQVLATLQRTGRGDLPAALSARAGLGFAQISAGDPGAGLTILRELYQRGDFLANPELRDRTAIQMASACLELGDLDEGRRLIAEVLPRVPAAERPGIRRHALRIDALLWAAAGQPARAQASVLDLLDLAEQAILAAAAGPLRDAWGVVATLGLGIATADEPGIASAAVARRAFEVRETARAAMSDSRPRATRAASDTKVAAALRRLHAAQDRLLRIAGPGEPIGASAEFADAVFERDAAERELLAALPAEHRPLPIRIDAIAAALPQDAIVVSYRTERPRRGPDPPQWLADVLRADGSLDTLRLGPTAPIRDAADAFRAELGAIAMARGMGRLQPRPHEPGTVQATQPSPAGIELRHRLIEPIRAAAPDARRWYILLDDVLHALPLDALPADPAAGDAAPTQDFPRVGDTLDLRVLTSQNALLRPTPAPAGADLAVVFGAIEYGGERPFAPLPGTAAESAAIHAAVAESAMQWRGFAGRAATREALLDAAPQATLLHIATHGYVAAATEADRAFWLAPLALCGLALADADLPDDPLGRSRGRVTGEELATLDLSRCRIAVLSACDSAAGLRHAGAGIASLQIALHAAGARSVITSLWQVEDALTARLMADFYRRLLVDGATPAAALHQAKAQLREAGVPAAAWAGFVITNATD